MGPEQEPTEEDETIGEMDETNLSQREKETLILLAKGKDIKHIAKDMGLDERTVDFSLANICDKLGIEDQGTKKNRYNLAIMKTRRLSLLE